MTLSLHARHDYLNNPRVAAFSRLPTGRRWVRSYIHAPCLARYDDEWRRHDALPSLSFISRVYLLSLALTYDLAPTLCRVYVRWRCTASCVRNVITADKSRHDVDALSVHMLVHALTSAILRFCWNPEHAAARSTIVWFKQLLRTYSPKPYLGSVCFQSCDERPCKNTTKTQVLYNFSLPHKTTTKNKQKGLTENESYEMIEPNWYWGCPQSLRRA